MLQCSSYIHSDLFFIFLRTDIFKIQQMCLFVGELLVGCWNTLACLKRVPNSFRSLDLHCLPNSPQDWAKVTLAWDRAWVSPLPCFLAFLMSFPHCSIVFTLPCLPDVISPLSYSFHLGTLLIILTLTFVSEFASEAYLTQFQELQHNINRKLGDRNASRGPLTAVRMGSWWL